MIIPGLDEIVYLTESIEDFRNAKGQEGLGQQETGNFHLQEPKVVYKAESLPYRYIIAFHEDSSVRSIESHKRMIQEVQNESVSKLACKR